MRWSKYCHKSLELGKNIYFVKGKYYHGTCRSNNEVTVLCELGYVTIGDSTIDEYFLDSSLFPVLWLRLKNTING